MDERAPAAMPAIPLVTAISPPLKSFLHVAKLAVLIASALAGVGGLLLGA